MDISDIVEKAIAWERERIAANKRIEEIDATIKTLQEERETLCPLNPKRRFPAWSHELHQRIDAIVTAATQDLCPTDSPPPPAPSTSPAAD